MLFGRFFFSVFVHFSSFGSKTDPPLFFFHSIFEFSMETRFERVVTCLGEIRVGRPGPVRDEAQPRINQRGIFSECSDFQNIDEEIRCVVIFSFPITPADHTSVMIEIFPMRVRTGRYQKRSIQINGEVKYPHSRAKTPQRI